MADKDSIRFLASELNNVGQSARQDVQQAQQNSTTQRYLQLAQLKDQQQQRLEQQQTAVGALDQMAQTKGVQDMMAAHDSDPSHLALYVAKAKAAIYSANPSLQQQLPSAMSGMKIPFFGEGPTPSFTSQYGSNASTPGPQPGQPMVGPPSFNSGLGFLLGLKSLQSGNQFSSTGNPNLDILSHLYGGR